MGLGVGRKYGRMLWLSPHISRRACLHSRFCFSPKGFASRFDLCFPACLSISPPFSFSTSTQYSTHTHIPPPLSLFLSLLLSSPLSLSHSGIVLVDVSSPPSFSHSHSQFVDYKEAAARLNGPHKRRKKGGRRREKLNIFFFLPRSFFFFASPSLCLSGNRAGLFFFRPLRYFNRRSPSPAAAPFHMRVKLEVSPT